MELVGQTIENVDKEYKMPGIVCSDGSGKRAAVKCRGGAKNVTIQSTTSVAIQFFLRDNKVSQEVKDASAVIDIHFFQGCIFTLQQEGGRGEGVRERISQMIVPRPCNHRSTLTFLFLLYSNVPPPPPFGRIFLTRGFT